MRFSKGLEFANKLLEVDVEALALEILDLLREYQIENKKLDERERFILGLRYSEFYAIGDSDDAYACAEKKREKYLNLLGITREEINQAVDGLF